jgi:hypothetical protein
MKFRCALALLALSPTACTTPGFVTSSQADVILEITHITGQSGGSSGGSGTGDVLNSDVLFKGSIINDNATIDVRVIDKNRLNPSLGGGVNDVTLTQYQVNYVRSDGLSQQGVDVPFSISGSLSLLVPSGGTGAVSIVVVRHQAKAEPPLSNLVTGTGGAGVLTVIAHITIFGQTTAGQVVQATGSLQINFANFGDS